MNLFNFQTLFCVKTFNFFAEDAINSSDEEDADIIDEDTCPDNDLNKLFTNEYHLASEECVSLKKSYILHMASSKSFEKVAATTSSGTVHLYDITTGLSRLKTPKCLDSLTSAITGVKFANSSLESVLVSTTENVVMVDLRSDEIVHTFKGESSDCPLIMSAVLVLPRSPKNADIIRE